MEDKLKRILLKAGIPIEPVSKPFPTSTNLKFKFNYSENIIKALKNIRFRLKKRIEKMLKKQTLFLIILLAFTSTLFAVDLEKHNKKVTLKNDLVSLTFDLNSGTYSAKGKDSRLCLKDAFVQINNFTTKKDFYQHSFSTETVIDRIGRAMTLKIKSQALNKPSLISKFTIYEKKAFIAMSAGLQNQTADIIHVKHIRPLAGGLAFPNFNIENHKMLDGRGGWNSTYVTRKDKLDSANNLLITFGKPNNTYSLVMGGLTYHDYEKYVEAKKTDSGFIIQLFAKDPIGKRLDPGKKYIPEDRFYLDFNTDNPFDALENYADTVKLAQDIKLETYAFPTVCLWYARPVAENTSIGAVEEMQHIADSGFLKYAPAAVRLVPDCYNENNQQGWWNNEHWQNKCPCLPVFGKQGFGRYLPPYETSEKWAQAVIKLGGIPLTYFQPGIRSRDYAHKFPEHMLYDHPAAPRLTGKGEPFYYNENIDPNLSLVAWKAGKMVKLSYDYTDLAFKDHLRDVYEDLKNAGIKGIMYDYPNQAWADKGGMENEYSTTAAAYRNVYELANQGLGNDSYLHERNLHRGSDITLGLVSSMRSWGDTNRISPEMVSRTALRWYKNRKLINWDMDSKHLHNVKPENKDGRRTMLTMAYVVSGRLLLGNSFSIMDQQEIYDLSRLYPFHGTDISARPVDAFIGKFPHIFDFPISPDWHQVALYNYGIADKPLDKETENPTQKRHIVRDYRYEENTFELPLSGDTAFGSIGLEPQNQYYLYDFWNDDFVGKFKGSQKVKQTLRPGETRMLSVHKVKHHPQFISTDRHLMQGYVDIIKTEWYPEIKTYTGTSKVIANDPYKITIALNGFQPAKATAENAEIEMKIDKENDIAYFTLKTKSNKNIDWAITFK